TITNEVKRYLQGGYGKPPAPVNQQIQRKAIGSEQPNEERPADALKPELDKLREDIGELAQSEDDVMIFAMFPDLGRDYLKQRQEGTLEPEALQAPQSDQQREVSSVATEFKLDVHGETYEVAITGVGSSGGGKRKLYISLDGMPEEVTFEALNEYVADKGDKRSQATKPGHVTAAMPGNIVEVLVSAGDQVDAGQAVLVTEAMKMETEIHANIGGKVTEVHVTKGDRVTPGEILMVIE
ncbi:MAG: biotin/lipoyl-binding protein, partial [Gammaproteobacteria bacterium]|nr:biotin/lipoyl-binding protein [Gammaproteobacteria bacterium]